MVIGHFFARRYGKRQLAHAWWHRFQGLLLPFHSHHCTHLMLALLGCRGAGWLTHIVLYSEVLLSQNTRPDALLSLKFPQPKLPVKTLLWRRRGKSGEKKGEVIEMGEEMSVSSWWFLMLWLKLKDSRVVYRLQLSSLIFGAMEAFWTNWKNVWAMEKKKSQWFKVQDSPWAALFELQVSSVRAIFWFFFHV